MLFSKRNFLAGTGIAGVVVGIASIFGLSKGSTAQAKGKFPFILSEADWQDRLTPEAYRVLRHAATERPFTSPLNYEKRSGTYDCAGCGKPLFASEDKFDSGTGWPSFTRAIKGAVGTTTDYKIGYPRTEVHCANCGGHQGHVFDDGPPPTGQRWCINGVALKFTAV